MNTPMNPKHKILVVDDDLDVNTTLALMLEFDGHEVQTAYTGEAALAMLEKRKFDLIITEYWLPRMKGNELAALVKQQWPNQPIIMATANLDELNMEVHPISGVDCLLDKPFSMLQLREAMVWVLDCYADRQQSSLAIHGLHAGLPVEEPEHTQSAPGGDNYR
jgi:DNA-binding response OmpR family regulator